MIYCAIVTQQYSMICRAWGLTKSKLSKNWKGNRVFMFLWVKLRILAAESLGGTFPFLKTKAPLELEYFYDIQLNSFCQIRSFLANNS